MQSNLYKTLQFKQAVKQTGAEFMKTAGLCRMTAEEFYRESEKCENSEKPIPSCTQ
jgi:hypothetical protein